MDHGHERRGGKRTERERDGRSTVVRLLVRVYLFAPGVAGGAGGALELDPPRDPEHQLRRGAEANASVFFLPGVRDLRRPLPAKGTDEERRDDRHHYPERPGSDRHRHPRRRRAAGLEARTIGGWPRRSVGRNPRRPANRDDLALPGVGRVHDAHKPYMLASRERGPTPPPSSRSATSAIGGGRPVLMAGPCVVEGREQLLAAARAVKAAGADMLRGGAFKPRTSPYAFQGLGEEGLRYLAAARDATGLPVVTEVMEPEQVDARRRVRRHAPDRLPQHGQLPAAAPGRRDAQAGPAQARLLGHRRRVADERRVRPGRRQPQRRPLRAGHPRLRSRLPLHPRPQRRAAGRRSCRTCRSSSTPATAPASARWWAGWPWPASPPAPTG